jgi:DNA-binding MarR family transcriptional regulator
VTYTFTTFTTTLTAAHVAVANTALSHELQNNEVRVLMAIVDGISPQMDTYEIEDATQIVSSNVRKAMYELDRRDLIEFVQRERGKNLIVSLTIAGRRVGRECYRHWDKA